MDNTLIASTGKAVTISALGAEALGVLYDLRWGLLLIVALIAADFWLGIAASLRRKEEFRFSRAGRRTCNKFAEYFTFMVIGALLGLAIFEPLGVAGHVATAGLCLSLGCLFEVDSIAGHVCDLHGITARFSLKRFVIALLKRRHADVGEAVEEAIGKVESGERKEESGPSGL